MLQQMSQHRYIATTAPPNYGLAIRSILHANNMLILFFVIAPEDDLRSSKATQGRFKSRRRRPKPRQDDPKTAQDLPRRPQDGSEKGPIGAHDGPKSFPNGDEKEVQ